MSSLDSVVTRLAHLHAQSPEALHLAQLCAFAVRLEPHLLRALRRRFLPHAGPSIELDLWFSPLVQSRSASAAVLDVAVLGRLREALSGDPDRGDIYETTMACFAGHPSLLRFEIELNALPVLDTAVGDAAIEARFAPLLKALRSGGEPALRAARWLLQAAPRWHPRVGATAAAWASLLASSALLDGRRLTEGTPPPELSIEQLAQALPPALSATTKIGVLLHGLLLRFVAPESPGAATVDVPVMSPALLLVEIDGQPRRVVEARPGSDLSLPNLSSIVLRSLLGDAWLVELANPSTMPEGTVRPPGAAVQPEHVPPEAPGRVQVFLSAGTDLIEYLHMVQRTLADRLYAILTTEAAVYPSRVPLESTRGLIERCDVFICIVGWRYGYVLPDSEANPNGLSTVEMEYQMARRLGKPVMLYLLDERAAAAASNGSTFADDQVRLRRFRQELASRHARSFETPEQLAQLVVEALAHWRRHESAEDRPLLQESVQRQRAIDGALRTLQEQGPDRLRAALSSDSVRVQSTRGPLMVSVSPGIEGFEGDNTFKAYEMSNHVFADLFGGANPRWPIVFFLSAENKPGVGLNHFLDAPSPVSLVSLGRAYTFIAVVEAIDAILQTQRIRLVRPWFIRYLRESEFHSGLRFLGGGIVSLPLQVEQFVDSNRSSLIGAHTLLVSGSDLFRGHPDPFALAEALSGESPAYGVLESNSRDTFLLRHGGQRFDDFATPKTLQANLQNEKLEVIVTEVGAVLDLWAELDARCFTPFQTVLVLTSSRDATEIERIEAFLDFRRVELDAGLMPGYEQ